MAAAAVKISEPELLSISEIAKRVKLDRATVRSRLDDLGYEPDPSSTSKNQLYPFDSEMEFAIKSAKDTVSAMKIRHLRADAQLKELKLAEQRAELVPMEEVVELSQSLHNTVYKEFAVNLPKRLAGRLSKTKTPGEVTKILKLETEKILKRLREIAI